MERWDVDELGRRKNAVLLRQNLKMNDTSVITMRNGAFPVHDDQKLLEMLILECFQAGLSWECVLNKRDAFRKAFDGFDLEKICAYHEDKLEMLRNNPEIIRNRPKIQAAVINAQAFCKIQKEYGSFSEYLWHWTDGRVIQETGKTSSELSDTISKDLKSMA